MSRPTSKEAIVSRQQSNFASSTNSGFASSLNNTATMFGTTNSSPSASFSMNHSIMQQQRRTNNNAQQSTTTSSTSNLLSSHHQHSSIHGLPPLISNYLPTTRRYSHTSIDLNSDATELSNYRENRVVTPVADDTFEGDKVGKKVTLDNNNNIHSEKNNNNNETSSSPTTAKKRIHLLSEFSSKINEALSVTARALNLDERRKLLDSRD